MKINNSMRIDASLRRLWFEFLNAIYIFKLIELIGAKIKEPYRTLYQRSKQTLNKE